LFIYFEEIQALPQALPPARFYAGGIGRYRFGQNTAPASGHLKPGISFANRHFGGVNSVPIAIRAQPSWCSV